MHSLLLPTSPVMKPASYRYCCTYSRAHSSGSMTATVLMLLLLLSLPGLLATDRNGLSPEARLALAIPGRVLLLLVFAQQHQAGK